MLSNDICRTDQLEMFGGCGYGNVLTRFVPLLRDRGVDDAAVDSVVANPPAPSPMTPTPPGSLPRESVRP